MDNSDGSSSIAAIAHGSRSQESPEAPAPDLPRHQSLLCGGPKNNDTVFARVEEAPWFRSATLLVIVLNALWICVDVEWNHSSLPLEPASLVVEHLFCAYFSAELLVRFLALRRRLLCVRDPWFLFDATLVLFMVLETWVLPVVGALSGGGGSSALANFSSFRLLRLLRLTRMAKIMRHFPELMTLVKGMINATQAVFFILVFLVIVMYIFAIVFTSQLGGPQAAEGVEAEAMFSDLGSSMMTLFTNGVLGDNLAQTLGAIKDRSLWLMWFFVLFMLISGVTLLNMLIGVLCQVIADSSREEEESQQMADLRSTLTQAFRSVDSSNDGVISELEWSQIKSSSSVREQLTKLGVEESQMDERLTQMQETLFGQRKSFPEDGKQGIDFEEFVDKVVELRWDTPARALDVEMLKATIAHEDTRLRRRLERLERGLGELLGGAGPGPGAREGARPTSGLAAMPTELLLHALRSRE